jgi:hypothetical protein
MALNHTTTNTDAQPIESEMDHQATVGADTPPQKLSRREPEQADGRPAKKVKPRVKASAAPVPKSEIVLKKLRSAKGATIEQLIEATGWQAHSVRGFLSATVKKRMGLELKSELGPDKVRRYSVQQG